MSSSVVSINHENFDQHITASSGLVLLDFWAEWCGPCKQLLPILDEVAEIYEDEVTVLKLNADENETLAQKYTVRGLPTMLVLVNGVEQERIVGLSSKTRITQIIEKYMDA